MSLLWSFLLVASVATVLARLYVVYEDKMSFFFKGHDFGFSFREVSSLWKLAKKCQIEEPLSLFVSEQAVTKCIAYFIEDAKSHRTENSYKVQSFLEQLYKFKTHVALDADKKKGLSSTKSILSGQKISIILKGKGVFNAKVINNSHELIVSRPVQINKKSGAPMFLKDADWVDKNISVYFWRKGDAAYSFDSYVLNAGTFRRESALYLKHTKDLVRTQKRQSIRCQCQIYAQMFFISGEIDSPVSYESYKCLLEDISEDGAMIRIGGKGSSNIQLKIQFEINGTVVIMRGVVRGVEYNAAMDQSRLHFECTEIEPSMKNTVLAYVYNVIPNEEKEVYEALSEVEKSEEQSLDSGAENLEG